jgi:hypothetical protein
MSEPSIFVEWPHPKPKFRGRVITWITSIGGVAYAIVLREDGRFERVIIEQLMLKAPNYGV